MIHVFKTGTLTISCYVHPDYKDGVKRYHGTTRVATINDVIFNEIEDILKYEIDAYLSRCRFKNCERSFSWKFETF